MKKKLRTSIPEEVKRLIYARANFMCEYPHHPCSETIKLEFHHKNGKKWSTNPRDILLLCSNHHKKISLIEQKKIKVVPWLDN